MKFATLTQKIVFKMSDSPDIFNRVMNIEAYERIKFSPFRNLIRFEEPWKFWIVGYNEWENFERNPSVKA